MKNNFFRPTPTKNFVEGIFWLLLMISTLYCGFYVWVWFYAFAIVCFAGVCWNFWQVDFVEEKLDDYVKELPKKNKLGDFVENSVESKGKKSKIEEAAMVGFSMKSIKKQRKRNPKSSRFE